MKKCIHFYIPLIKLLEGKRDEPWSVVADRSQNIYLWCDCVCATAADCHNW